MAAMGIHKIAAEASDALGEQAGDSLDLITRAVLVAETANAQFANGRANTASIVAGDYLTLVEVMKAMTTLRSNKAVGPLKNGNYPALLHPKSCYDMYADTLFQSVLAYSKDRGEQNPWITGHIGTAFGVDFYETANGYYADNGTVDVYSTMILGKGSFGVGGLAAYMPQVIREQQNKGNHTFEKVRPLRLIQKPFGSTGTADPFDRLASIAWYTTFCAIVLDNTFYVRIEHDVAL
jgi:N4-gp56 family major capsid protein